MISSIAEIRQRHAMAPPRPAMPPALPPAAAPAASLAQERAEWIATVCRADITRTLKAGGGYVLHVGRRAVALVEPADKEGRHVVVNLAAGRIRSPALARGWADTLALRIARNEALE